MDSTGTQPINHKQNYPRSDACMHWIFNRMRRRPFFLFIFRYAHVRFSLPAPASCLSASRQSQTIAKPMHSIFCGSCATDLCLRGPGLRIKYHMSPFALVATFILRLQIIMFCAETTMYSQLGGPHSTRAPAFACIERVENRVKRFGIRSTSPTPYTILGDWLSC